MADTITGGGWLIVRKKERPYRELGLRLSLKKPRLDPGEVAIKLDVELPNSLFEKPTLKASIQIDERKVTAREVSAEVIDNIEQVVMEQCGINLTISSEEV